MANEFFQIKNKQGEWVDCELLDVFYNGVTQKNYLIYTNNQRDEEGRIKVYASLYNPEEYTVRLKPITSEGEWDAIERYLEQATQSEETNE